MTSTTMNGSGKYRSSTSRKMMSIGRKAEVPQALSIIDDRLFFMISRFRPKNSQTCHFFTVDHLLKYEPFFVDFGPLSLGCLYKFCVMLTHKLKDRKYDNCRIYYYCDKDPQRVANACYLIGAFQVIELGRHPGEAYARIREFAKKSVPFRDASMGICTYRCSVEHCTWAVYRALQKNFLNFKTFNVDEYEYYERVEYGDLNVIVPNKFLAFAGPHYKEFDEEGYPALTPDFYLPIWKKFNVRTIIRLNKKCYDRRIWTREGYDHFDLYFIDGTTPSTSIIHQFLDICEKSQGVVAVHCKAGLGRTGSLIGCYLMKHFCWTAHEVIAWLRICRPGSVIGPQQHFLDEQQAIMWKAGDEYRAKRNTTLDPDPRLDSKQAWKEHHKLSRRSPKKHSKHKPQRNGYGNLQSSASNKEDVDMLNTSTSSLSTVSVSTANRIADTNAKMKSYSDPNSSLPLATDPGQNQGQALLNAKRQHSPERVKVRPDKNKNSDVEMKQKTSNSLMRGLSSRLKFGFGQSKTQ